MASIIIQGDSGTDLTLSTVGVPVGVQGTRTITAGAGMIGGGDLSADRTLNVVAHADASIVVNADSIQVGVLASDAQHGVRGGGTQHAAVVAAGAAGFMTGADKTKLDGIAASAAALTSSTPADIGTTTVGIATTAARADHVHAHGNQAGGSTHAAVIAAGASGFMTGADKTKLDGIAVSAAALTSSTPTTTAFGATGAAGSASTAAKADHTHAFAAQTTMVQFTGVLANTNRKFLEYTPPNGPGKFNFIVNNAANPGDVTRDDHVLLLGYNVGRGGGVESSSDMQFSIQIESHWDDGGGMPVLEHHWKYTRADGSVTRAPMSMNIRKTDYYTQGRFGFDVLYFGSNTASAGGGWALYTGTLLEGDSTVTMRRVGLGSWFQQYNGAGAYENLIHLETGLNLVLGGQTFNDLRLGIVNTVGRAHKIIGEDCGATGDQAGGDIDIAGGRGRGTGAGGSVYLSTAPAAGSSSSQNALVRRWQVDSSGNLLNASSGYISPASGVKWLSGANTPEGAVTAAVGSLYTRTDGGTLTTLYVKESGSGNTGWAAK